MSCTKVRSARGGFTLIEVAVATTIVGVGLAALMVSVESSTRVNDAGGKLAQGTFLAQEIREWTLTLPFSTPVPAEVNNPPGPDGGVDPHAFVDDLDDFLGFDGQGTTFKPPRDGMGNEISSLPDWSQTITLSWRDPNNVAAAATHGNGTTNVIYVHVDVGYRDKTVYGTNWLVTRKK
jgi:prepilin-type N-terminal cleavage/methylation domain-containing protein